MSDLEMKRKTACAIAALLTLLILSTANLPAAGVTYAPAVTVGTVANYSYQQTNFPAGYSVTIRVTDVSGTNITFEKDEYNPSGSLNNTHTTTYDVTDVLSWTPIWFIAGDLSTPDNLTQYSYPWWITATFTGFSIAGKTWTVNYMSGLVTGLSVNATWDQQTGLLLQWSSLQDGTSINVTLTSLGSPSALPPSIILIGVGVAAVIIVIAAVLVLRKRK